MNTNRLVEHLRSLDQTEAIDRKFDEHRAKHGLAAAVVQYGDDSVHALMVRRLVEPLLRAHVEMSEEEWSAAVRNQAHYATRRLLEGCWRANSTSVMQNAVSQWESIALADFIRCVEMWS